MRDFLDQVSGASDCGLFYVALAGALMVPDMCGALESSDGVATRDRYIDWCERYLCPRYVVGPARTPALTGDDVYGLRCSMLHQARLTPHRGGYSRVLFLEPNEGGRLISHRNVTNDALNIDVQIFVADVVAEARDWLAGAAVSAAYKANYGQMMQRYPTGLPPYLEGAPVIA